MKLCKDCVWSEETQAGYMTVHKCLRPEAKGQDPVTGNRYQYECFMFRGSGLMNCGPEAKYYEEFKK